MRQIEARWPGNPVSLARILELFGPNLLPGYVEVNQPSVAERFD